MEVEAGALEGFNVKGFHEVLLSVRDIDKSAKFYKEVAGWKEIATYRTQKSQLTYWGLPEDARATESLLVCPGVGTGHVRLIQFHDVDQKPIRANSQTWDTGGIYDLDVRAQDIDESYLELQAHGWSGFSRPAFL